MLIQLSSPFKSHPFLKLNTQRIFFPILQSPVTLLDMSCVGYFESIYSQVSNMIFQYLVPYHFLISESFLESPFFSVCSFGFHLQKPRTETIYIIHILDLIIFLLFATFSGILYICHYFLKFLFIFN